VQENQLARAGADTTLALTTEIVAAFVRRNRVPPENLVDTIRSVYRTVAALAGDPTQPAGERPKPAVPITKSVQADYIVCLEDGRKLKMLKRYLRAAYGLTPEEYRKRWGLPADYPMVAPNYAARRSDFAKRIGLGKAGKKRS
jgi:predicted transcriptional regulator